MSDRRERPWHFYRTAGIEVEEHGGVRFLKGDRAWLAMWTHGIGDMESVRMRGRAQLRNPTGQWMTAPHEADWNLVALEYGEVGDYETFAAFRDAVLANSRLEIDADAQRADTSSKPALNWTDSADRRSPVSSSNASVPCGPRPVL